MTVIKQFRVLVAVAIVLSSQFAHAATCSIKSEDEFVWYMDLVATGQATAKECPDPDPNYDKYVYLEITDSITLTKPISIPDRVHIVGVKKDANAIIGASYNVAINKSSPPCILSFIGDQVVLENVQITASTYRSVIAPISFTVDNAICMKGNYGLVNNVSITNPDGATPYGFMQVGVNGINIIGDNNTVTNSKINLSQGVGLAISGKKSIVTKNTVTTQAYAVVIQSSDNTISDNQFSGKNALIFTYPYTPVGQAADIVLSNMLISTNPDMGELDQSFSAVYQKTVTPGQPNSIPLCGTCVNETTKLEVKIPHNDDGSCKTADICKAVVIKIPAQEVQSDIIQTQSQKQPESNQNSTAPAKPETTKTEVKPLSALQPQVNSQSGVGGSCNLIRE